MALKILLPAILLTASQPLFAQEKPVATASFSVEGQLAASTDGKGVFINAGGPALKFHFKKFAFSVNMMPSLRFQNDGKKPFVTPILGCGPQFYLLKDKRYVISFPAYYYTSSQVWTFTAGIGYVLTKPKGK